MAAAVVFVLSASSLMAVQPSMHDLTPQFLHAGVTVQGLRAVEVGGVIVLRGRVADRSGAERASAVAHDLGYTRVANLIQVDEIPDDTRITRDAERELAAYPCLNDARIAVDSTNGVVRLHGKFSDDLVKNMAVNLVRNIVGVRAVQVAIQR